MSTLRTTAALTGLVLAAPVIAASIPATRSIVALFGATSTTAVLLSAIAAALILAIGAGTPGVRLLAHSIGPATRHVGRTLSARRDLALAAALSGAVMAMAAVTIVVASRGPVTRLIVVPGGEPAPARAPVHSTRA